MSSILEEFIKQTYGSFEGALEADKRANEREEQEAERSRLFVQKALEHQAMANEPVSVHMDIPSLIIPGSLNEKTESHEHFSGYDHSLEKERWADLVAGRSEKEIELERDAAKELGIREDYFYSTEEYARIDPANVPDLSGIFDGNFMWPDE